MEPSDRILSYATPSLPLRTSHYAFASLAMSALSFLWLALEILNAPLPFSADKQHRIGTIASVLAVILAIAACWQPNRKRPVAYLAFMLSSLTFLAYALLIPL